MRPKLIIFLFTLFSMFSSCKEETPLTFKDMNITTKDNKIVEINILEAIGDETISKNINTQVNQTVTSALHIGDPGVDIEASVEESINNFNKAFETFKTDFPESPQQWEAQIDGEVIYQSPNIISMAITSYTNSGGAHGILTVTFLNFDTQTGRKLGNKDLINATGKFKQLAKTYFDQEIEGKRELYFEPDNFTLPANIGYNDDGLILLYNSYEIAPYSTGLTEFTIPYEATDEYLNFK